MFFALFVLDYTICSKMEKAMAPHSSTLASMKSSRQGIFPTQGLNPLSCISCIGRRVLSQLSHQALSSMRLQILAHSVLCCCLGLLVLGMTEPCRT